LQVLTETPGATPITSLYSFSTPSNGYLVKFILPACVAMLGLLAFFMTAGLLLYIYSTTSKVTRKPKQSYRHVHVYPRRQRTS